MTISRLCLGVVSLLALFSLAPVARGEEPGAGSDRDVVETGRKLSNPLSDVSALFMEFDLNFADGDLNLGQSEVGIRTIIQPILPFPLRGRGKNKWSLITRPTIPVLLSEPIPSGLDAFDRKGGLGDTQLPMVVSPPTGKWLLGVGPAFLIPTSTNDAFGRQQWGVGPAVVVGYQTKTAVFGTLGQYYSGIGSRGDRDPGIPDASYLHLLYFMFINLPEAWQVGFDPTVTFDDRASSGNKWNVPVMLLVAKTTPFGKLPVKFQAGIEYSVVSQEAYGQHARFILDVIPVIRPMVRRPLLGGE